MSFKQYTCRCGKHNIIRCFPPANCESCKSCGSTLKERSEQDYPLKNEHQFIELSDPVFTAVKYEVCKNCGIVKHSKT